MDSGGGPGPPRPAGTPASQLPATHDGNIGLFPFNAAVNQQESQLGAQIARSSGVMGATAQPSAPFPNIPFMSNIPQATPSVSVPTNNAQRINPQANMLRQINAAAAAAHQSAAMEAGNLPQNLQPQQTRDFFGELEKVFASKPGQDNSATRGADVLDNALAMAMASHATSRQQQTVTVDGQQQPQLQQAQLQQQRLQQLEMQHRLQQQLQQQQRQLRHPSVIPQSIMSRQQMHPYMQQKQLAPGQLNARMLLPDTTLPGQPTLTPGQLREQTLSSRGQAVGPQLAQSNARVGRKQQPPRRPRAKPDRNIPIGARAQFPNAVASTGLNIGLPQQGQAAPAQLGYTHPQNRYQQASGHFQRHHTGLPAVVQDQAGGATLGARNIQPSVSSASFPLSSPNAVMGAGMLQQQTSAALRIHQSGVQGLSSAALLNARKIPQRVPQGNPDMAKFDAATLQSVLRSTNDPKIKAAIKQQLEYLQYVAAFSGAERRGQIAANARRVNSGIGTNAQDVRSISESGTVSGQDPSHVSQAALLQRQQMLQKRQLFRQQQQQLQQQQLQQQQLQQQQLQQQQLQQQQLQQQQLQQQQLQQQQLQQQQLQQQQLQQQQLQQQQLQQQQLQQQQLQLRSHGSLPQMHRGAASQFPRQGLPGPQQGSSTAHGGQSTNALPTHLRNQIHAHQLQQAQRRAQHSQSSHSQSASQDTRSDFAGEGQAPGSQNSQRQSRARRPRRSPRIGKNGSEGVSAIPGISSHVAVHPGQNSGSGSSAMPGQSAETQTKRSRVSESDPAGLRIQPAQGLDAPTSSRSAAEAVAQAAQAAQLAAGRAANAKIRTVDDQRVAEDRKRLAREAELANIAQQKKRRLQTAPWNDYQRILAPDYTTPFSGLVDAWQRLVPYHVVLTDEGTCVSKQEWDSEIDKLAKKYRDCFRSLKGSLNRLFDAGFESIGSAAELPGYSSLCKDDSLILDSILLRDYYETARKQALIAQENEMRAAPEMARQRSLAVSQAASGHASMRGSAPQIGAPGRMPPIQPSRTIVPSAGTVSGALPPLSGPALMATMRHQCTGASTPSSQMAAYNVKAKSIPTIQQPSRQQYVTGPSSTNGLQAAGLKQQASFAVQGYRAHLHGRQSAISTSQEIPSRTQVASEVNSQPLANSNFQLGRSEMNNLKLPPSDTYRLAPGLVSQPLGLEKKQSLATHRPNTALFRGAPTNGPHSLDLQSSVAKGNVASDLNWSRSRGIMAERTALQGMSAGNSTRMATGDRSEIVRNGLQQNLSTAVTAPNTLKPPVSLAATSRVETSHQMAHTKSSGQAVKPERLRSAGTHVTSLNGSSHGALNSEVPNFQVSTPGIMSSHGRSSLGKGTMRGGNDSVRVESVVTRPESVGMMARQGGASAELAGRGGEQGGMQNLQRSGRGAAEKGRTSAVVAADGSLGVLSSRPRDDGQGSGKGGEFRGMGMGSLLNADGS